MRAALWLALAAFAAHWALQRDPTHFAAEPTLRVPVRATEPAPSRPSEPSRRAAPDFGGRYGRSTGAVPSAEARTHFALGAELLRMGDYYTAASHLAMARDGLGDAPAVCELLAVTYDRLNMTGDLLEVMPCLDEAARESDSAAQLYDRLAKQLDVEVEFQAAASDHFVASFPSAGPAMDEIGPVLDLLEGARDRVDHELGLGSMRLVPVVVYESGQFEAATDKPHWASGLYDGKIRMSIETYREHPAFFETALTHEYVHALTHEYTGTRLPPWFREGIADALARNGSDAARHYRPAPAVGRILEIDELESSFMRLPEAVARAAYRQSHAMALGLVRETGWDALRDLILDLYADRSLDFDAAFLGIYGESPADYLDRWHATLR
jgi:hypothetical protein